MGRRVDWRTRVVVDPETGCHRYTGAHDKDGYCSLKRHGRMWLVHRLAWTEEVGPIPEGHHIDHLCKTRDCVLIEHLEPVLPRVNLDRSNAASTLNRAKRGCGKADHPEEYDAADRKGWRYCRRCTRDRVAAYRARRVTR